MNSQTLFYFQQFQRELLIRFYSPKTVKAYELGLRQYFDFLKSAQPFSNGQILIANNAQEDVKNFMLYKKRQNCAPKTLHVYLSAVKFFYREILKIPDPLEIKFPKRTMRLPVVLSHEKIVALIGTIYNLKHRLILSLGYGSGMRVSEVANLKVKNLDFAAKLIYIQNAKGGKDRTTILPEPILTELQDFVRNKDPNDWVFESQQGGKLTVRTLQKVLKNAIKKLHLDPDASFHSLRHSFATHLLEGGVDIRFIQELLGHQNIRTTAIYTQVTAKSLHNIKSPL